MSTQAVSFTSTTNNWTGTLDVTDCNLLSDTTVKDFSVFYGGVMQGDVEKALWAKTSQTVLTYSGTNVDNGTIVRIQRKTPTDMVHTVSNGEIIRATDWNSEHDRHIRWKEEVDAFGADVTLTGAVSDEAYGTGWNGVTSVAPSKNAVYDKIETVVSGSVSDTTYASSWNGVTTVAPSKNAVYDVVNDLLTGTVSFSGAKSFTGTFDTGSATYVYVPNISSTVATAATGSAIGYSTAASFELNMMSGRLSPVSGDPIGDTGANSTTLYYVPIQGKPQYVSLYDSSSGIWRLYPFTAEVSLSMSGLGGNTRDVFLYWTGSALALTTQAWTSDQSRGSSKLTTQNNVPVMYSDSTRRWVGVIRGEATTNYLKNAFYVTGTSGDAICRVWNAYNQHQITLFRGGLGNITIGNNVYYTINNTYPISSSYLSFVCDDSTTTGHTYWRESSIVMSQCSTVIATDTDTSWGLQVYHNYKEVVGGGTIRGDMTQITHYGSVFNSLESSLATEVAYNAFAGWNVIELSHKMYMTNQTGSATLTSRDDNRLLVLKGLYV
jgi:hypothetical protein